MVLEQVSERILALDLGKRRIGVAVSDPLRLTAQGLPTLTRENRRKDFAALARMVSEQEARLVVVGHPLRMSGESGPEAKQAERFAEVLAAHCGVEVKLWDERLTTRQASRVLRESGIGLEKRKRAVDQLSAVLILQSYLDFLSVRQQSETPSVP